ncbi:Mothers against decapentaplegic-like protein 4 [Aphelenchoides avenae]|nr:Mothers against decapentaplegic-like protein 4 [Aphelenchus avenae]
MTYLIDSLMQYNKSPEVEFSRKVIESLVKKLKDKPLEIGVLVDVVRSGGRYPGTCVTINRTFDGRLQVAERKVYPHAVYVQIFRWPDVPRAELRSISRCYQGFDARSEAVCVNPYHYERALSRSPATITRMIERIRDNETEKDIIVLDD